MDILRISILGTVGVLLGILLKSRAPEYTSLITVDGSYSTTLLKMIGITYIGQFSSGICKDAGYASTGAQIDLFCRLSVMVLSMPVLLALLDTIQGFLV